MGDGGGIRLGGWGWGDGYVCALEYKIFLEEAFIWVNGILVLLCKVNHIVGWIGDGGQERLWVDWKIFG